MKGGLYKGNPFIHSFFLSLDLHFRELSHFCTCALQALHLQRDIKKNRHILRILLLAVGEKK
jgi:hypothetical protein